MNKYILVPSEPRDPGWRLTKCIATYWLPCEVWSLLWLVLVITWQLTPRFESSSPPGFSNFPGAVDSWARVFVFTVCDLKIASQGGSLFSVVVVCAPALFRPGIGSAFPCILTSDYISCQLLACFFLQQWYFLWRTNITESFLFVSLASRSKGREEWLGISRFQRWSLDVYTKFLSGSRGRCWQQGRLCWCGVGVYRLCVTLLICSEPESSVKKLNLSKQMIDNNIIY